MRIGMGHGYPEKSDPSARQEKLVQLISRSMCGAMSSAYAGKALVTDKISDEQPLSALREAELKLHYAGYKIVNFDIVLKNIFDAETEMLDDVRQQLCSVLYLKPEQLTLKVSVGDVEALPGDHFPEECMAVVLMAKRDG